MGRLALVFALLLATSAAYGQLPLPPIVSAATNSVIDLNGNLILFDVSYSYPATPNPSTALRFPPVVKTHVTVITVTARGTVKTSFDYDGALQVAGVGRRAVYAIVSTTGVTTIPIGAPGQVPTSIVSVGGSTVSAGAETAVVPTPIAPIAFTVNRRLVALNVVAGTLPTPLPSIDALGGADVKISDGVDNGAPDTIALIDSALLPPILAAGMTSPGSTASHSVRLFTFNGGSFTPINQTPISIP